MNAVKIYKHGPGFILSYMGIDIGLDTGAPRTMTLLSHAHADHITNLGRAFQVVATDATIDTFRARGGSVSWEHISLDYGQTLDFHGIEITSLNAGHVLGSTMFLIKYGDGLSVLYTGDYNTEDSIVHKAAEPVPADVLITEATYGSPQWVFPERLEIHKAITERVVSIIESGRLPILYAYSLGKAQEAIALLQKQKILTITGNYTIEKVNKAYNKYGANLKSISPDSPHVHEYIDMGCAIISSQPRSTIRRIEKQANLGKYEIENKSQVVNLTGWSLNDFSGNNFPLSAHCDFNRLVRFVQEVGARVVYCFTSNANEFSQHLSHMNINAVPLE